jgi:hypothetical protein
MGRDMEGLKEAVQRPFKTLFGEMPLFELTKERLEKIDPADYPTINELVQNKGLEKHGKLKMMGLIK